MSRKTFRPRSRQQDEREITRFQDNFSDGLFEDIPASNINNGVAGLENMINYGDRLVGRGGSKEWSTTVLPNLRSRGPYTATKSSSTITISSGGDFTSEDVGNYFYWSDTGAYERISAVASTSSITVEVADTHTGSVTNCYVAGPCNGLFFHRTENKIVAHVDTRVFYTDPTTISWTQVFPVSTTTVADGHSSMDEFRNYVVLGCSSGIFLIDLSSTYPIMWKANSPVPTAQITSSGSGDYKRRYLYSMSRLAGSGLRDRTTDGVYIIHESGTTAINDYGIDYGEMATSTPISDSNVMTVEDLTYPSSGEHWTHYSLYATADVGENGLNPIDGEGNQKELYIWLADVPVAKAFTATRSGTTVTASTNVFEQADEGSVITFADATTATILAYTSAQQVTVNSSASVTQAASIGCTSIMTASQAVSGSETVGNATITRTAGATFDSGDVGKQVFWQDGSVSVIVEYLTANTVEVENARTITSSSACMDPSSRKYYDEIPDENDDASVAQLKARAGSFSLQQRFWTPIPSSNRVLVVPGFFFAGIEDDNFVYYGQLPDSSEHLLGYHYIEHQYTNIKDGLVALVEMTDKVIVFGRTSTISIPTNTFGEQKIEQIGEYIAVISGQNTIDGNLGCLDIGSIQKIDNGLVTLICSDGTHRLFDGERYSESLSENRVEKQIAKWRNAYASSYDQVNGYVIWGLDE